MTNRCTGYPSTLLSAGNFLERADPLKEVHELSALLKGKPEKMLELYFLCWATGKGLQPPT